MRKDEIRSRVKAQKAMLSAEERQRASSDVFAALEASAPFMMASSILLYHSLADELSTHEFLARWHGRKRLFLPRVSGADLELLPYSPDAVAEGAFHIQEPTGRDVARLADMELVVVPAVAFDRLGNRVGRGRGYYDRLLGGCRAVKIGVGYDFQLLPLGESIDAEPHDVAVDIIITPSETVNASHRR